MKKLLPDSENRTEARRASIRVSCGRAGGRRRPGARPEAADAAPALRIQTPSGWSGSSGVMCQPTSLLTLVTIFFYQASPRGAKNLSTWWKRLSTQRKILSTRWRSIDTRSRSTPERPFHRKRKHYTDLGERFPRSLDPQISASMQAENEPSSW